MTDSWLSDVFQGITSLGVVYGIWNTILGRRETVAAAREAAAHALAAVSEIKHVAIKVEEVRHETNSLTQQLVRTTGEAREAVGEKRGIAIGQAMDRPAVDTPVAPSNPTEER